MAQEKPPPPPNLGNSFQQSGKKVLLAAADTYRAAAIDQLQVWADRLNLPVIAGQPDSDPGAVAYDAVQSALARKFDIVLVDTAGRLHTRYNLMEELKKVHRVVGKALPGAPTRCAACSGCHHRAKCPAPGQSLPGSRKGKRCHPLQTGFICPRRHGLCHPKGTWPANSIMPGWAKNLKICSPLTAKHLSTVF